MTHPIEVESFAILRRRVDLAHLGPRAADVVARVVHATADTGFAKSMEISEDAVSRGISALAAGAPVICDVEMVRAGLGYPFAHCYLSAARTERRNDDVTLSAVAMGIAAERHPRGAVVVVGCAPTALVRTIALWDEGLFEPALVIGLPVGFVGAADSKESLLESGIASITNHGERGGSAAAAAALNALWQMTSPPGSSSSSRVVRAPEVRV